MLKYENYTDGPKWFHNFTLLFLAQDAPPV